MLLAIIIGFPLHIILNNNEYVLLLRLEGILINKKINISDDNRNKIYLALFLKTKFLEMCGRKHNKALGT